MKHLNYMAFIQENKGKVQHHQEMFLGKKEVSDILAWQAINWSIWEILSFTTVSIDKGE